MPDYFEEIATLLKQPMSKEERQTVLMGIDEEFCSDCGGINDIDAQPVNRCDCVIWSDE